MDDISGGGIIVAVRESVRCLGRLVCWVRRVLFFSQVHIWLPRGGKGKEDSHVA